MELPSKNSTLSNEDLEKLNKAITYLDLPDEYWFEVGVLLPYDKLGKFCSRHSKFRNICNDTKFWKRRLELWYPEVISHDLSGQQYRGWYLMALSKELQEEANQVSEQWRDLIKDKKEKFIEKVKAYKPDEWPQELKDEMSKLDELVLQSSKAARIEARKLQEIAKRAENEAIKILRANW